jgi:hypothetical protein
MENVKWINYVGERLIEKAVFTLGDKTITKINTTDAENEITKIFNKLSDKSDLFDEMKRLNMVIIILVITIFVINSPKVNMEFL